MIKIVLLFCFFSIISPNTWGMLCQDWPLWQSFKNNFISADGRVIDHQNNNKITTSEGQAYALFFALVAGDQAQFKQLLEWTNNNLSQGKLGEQLPAWKWGESPSGDWKVLDYNSASDADVWISYALQEAGRLWNNRHYTQLGKQLANLILQKEAIHLPNLGLTLLPAPYGFHPSKNTWRLNPSYFTIPLFQYFALSDSRWKSVINSSYRIISQSLINGFAPDWTQYRARQGIEVDPQTQGLGSYDAIRVYLWAGMIHPEVKHQKPLLKRLSAMRDMVEQQGYPSTYINEPAKTSDSEAPIGFSAALLPFLASSNSTKGLISQLSRLLKNQQVNKKHYYTQVLLLFGLGWYQKFYHFDPNGRLILHEHHSCNS